MGIEESCLATASGAFSEMRSIKQHCAVYQLFCKQLNGLKRTLLLTINV